MHLSGTLMKTYIHFTYQVSSYKNISKVSKTLVYASIQKLRKQREEYYWECHEIHFKPHLIFSHSQYNNGPENRVYGGFNSATIKYEYKKVNAQEII